MRIIAFVLLLLILSQWLFCGEPYDGYRMDKKLVNALIAFLREAIVVFKAILKTDIDPALIEQIKDSIGECQKILRVLEE